MIRFCRTKLAARSAVVSMFFVCNLLAADLEQQDIFIAGRDGYHSYRIPSLIVTKNGTLLAFCEGRVNSVSDAGDIDIVLKRSTDGGKTWSEQVVVWNDGPNTCGNPCPVVDQKTGTIWLSLTHNLGGDSEAEINSKTARSTRTVWISQSKNDGKTWSAPVEITSSVKESSWGWYATGPGVGIQIQHGPHKGRLVIPCDHSEGPSPTPARTVSASHVIYSDDHGKSWNIGGTARPGMNECQVVELADGKGSMLLSMRNHPRGDHRAESISHDGGKTWSEPVRNSQLIDPTCQASILRYNWPTKKGELGRILFSNPASNRRRNLTVRLSYDDGKTWPISNVLWAEDAAYSCLAVMKDGQIGCLYERGERNAYEKITFARFSTAWLENK